MRLLFVASLIAGVAVFSLFCAGVGFVIDVTRIWWLRRTFLMLRGDARHGNHGLRHRETDRELARLEAWPAHDAAATRGSRQRGLDIAESLSDYSTRRPRASESMLGAVPGDLSADAQYPRAGRDDRTTGRLTTLRFPSNGGAPTRVK